MTIIRVTGSKPMGLWVCAFDPYLKFYSSNTICQIVKYLFEPYTIHYVHVRPPLRNFCLTQSTYLNLAVMLKKEKKTEYGYHYSRVDDV